MLWLVIGYLFLFIFRPYEYWPILGEFRIERIYMMLLLLALFLNKEKRYIPHEITRAALLFFASMVISGLFASHGAEAFDQCFEYFKLLVFYFVIILCLRDEADLKTFLFAYLAIMLLYVGKSEWEFFVHDRYTFRMGIKRLGGIDTTYGDPNFLAASIAYSLPFLWAMLRGIADSPWSRRLLYGYAAMVPVAIIFTGSRSGMVTTVLFLLLVWLGGKRKILGIAALIVILAGSWSLMPESYQIRFQSVFVEGSADEAGQKGAEESAQGRKEGLLQGIRVFKQYPVTGIGPGNIVYSWAGTAGEEKGMKTHNLYGILLGELGAAGFLSFSLFVGLILRTGWANQRQIKQQMQLDQSGPESDTENKKLLHLSYLTTACTQTILLLMFNGNFGHNLYRYTWLWLGAITVLISYFLTQSAKSEEPQSWGTLR